MALMKQGACLRHVWRLLARKGLNCLLLVVLSSLALPAQARNHFIVLFDASGSMKKSQYTCWNPETNEKELEKIDNPFWQGKSTRDSEAMAGVLSEFIQETLTEIPEAVRDKGFKGFNPGKDIFSFLMFVADWENPNFAPEELFYTHTNLLARSDTLPNASDYKSFNILPKSVEAEKSSARLTSVFSGHSPIIASTNLSMPFIADRMREQNRQDEFDQVVDKIFIIRVSDGQYNARSNGSDEHNVVQDNAALVRKTDVSVDAQKGFERYKDIAGQVTRVFDIGAGEAQRVIPFDDKCESGEVMREKSGMSLLINYLKVEPKAPGIAALARTEATRVQLQMGYRPEDSGQANAGVRLTGENRIRVDSSSGDDSHFKLLPKESMALQASIDGGNNWQACSLEDGFGDCGNAGPRFDFSPADLPDSIYYRASYMLELNHKKGPALYPYRISLETLELPEVRLDKARTLDRIYELPRDPNDDHFLDYIDPRRLSDLPFGAAPQYPVLGIDAKTLEQKAEAWLSDIEPRLSGWQKDWGLEDIGLILPRMIARVSEEKKAALIRQEQWMDISVWLSWTIIPFLVFYVRSFIPRRKLHPELVLDKNPVVLDLNNRAHDRVFWVGALNIKNEITDRFGFKKIEAQLSLPREDGDKLKGLELNEDRQAAPFAIGQPGKHLLKEKKIPSQKDIPMFFDPREFVDVDLEHLPEADPAAKLELNLPVRVALSTVHIFSKKRKQSDASLPLQILPERGRLHIDTPAQFTEKEAEDGRPVIEVDFESGQQVEVCCYRLHNSAQHRYSHRVQGELKVEIIQTDDTENQDDSKARAVLLRDGHSTGSAMRFNLGYQEHREFTVLADCNYLDHPSDYDNYEIKVSEKQTGDAENILQVWTLRLKRSTKRTDVSMQVIQAINSSDDQRSKPVVLNNSNKEGEFEIGSSQQPADVQRHRPGDPESIQRLFQVRLANSCKSGFGLATWQLKIETEIDENGANGAKVKNDNSTETDKLIYVRDHERADIPLTGELKDSTKESEQELYIELNFSKVEILTRDFQITFIVTVAWQVYKEGTDESEVFKTTMRVPCYLRDIPPDHVLAIDFGTSALAIAYANAPETENAGLLSLGEHLKKKFGTGTRYLDDPNNKDSPYLASVVNVNVEADEQKPDKLKGHRPLDSNFLDLPMTETALYQRPKLCFSSIKALISAGRATLPLAGQVEYLAEGNGTGMTTSDPKLADVLVGAYKGLLDNFVNPIVQDEKHQGYSYLQVTHPNTYTRNHVENLRKIVERAFKGVGHTSSANTLYPENIGFMSESDAVAYYYLMYARKWRKNGAEPQNGDCERILVYDIGAGTLDLTYLEIEWEIDSNRGRRPHKENSPGVLRRDGVTRAGDLLDECIARDLHQLLRDNEESTDKKFYKTHIVVDFKNQEMESKEIQLMDELRQQIQKLKRDLSEGKQDIRLKLTGWKAEDMKLVETALDEKNQELYKDCEQLRGDNAGNVFWEPTIKEIEAGEFVKGFLDRVTGRELELFFKGTKPEIDTLIISGRTSLWPGFKERVIATLKRLGRGPHNIIKSSDADPDEFKRAVVMGALEKVYRWTDFRFKEPKIQSQGDFGVRYEINAGQWKFTSQELGETKNYSLGNATNVEIGLRTNNGFHCCHTFSAQRASAKDDPDNTLDIILELDKKGALLATITAKNGISKTLSPQDFPTLTYRRQPWPLSAFRLDKKTPDELFGAEDEPD